MDALVEDHDFKKTQQQRAGHEGRAGQQWQPLAPQAGPNQVPRPPLAQHAQQAGPAGSCSREWGPAERPLQCRPDAAAIAANPGRPLVSVSGFNSGHGQEVPPGAAQATTQLSGQQRGYDESGAARDNADVQPLQPGQAAACGSGVAVQLAGSAAAASHLLQGLAPAHTGASEPRPGALQPRTAAPPHGVRVLELSSDDEPEVDLPGWQGSDEAAAEAAQTPVDGSEEVDDGGPVLVDVPTTSKGIQLHRCCLVCGPAIARSALSGIIQRHAPECFAAH